MNRRITFLVVFSLTLFLHKAYTRNIPENEWSLGIHSGHTLSSVAFIPKVQQSYTSGWRAGFSFRRISEKHLGVVTELSLAKYGWTEKPFSDFTCSLTYLELPFLTHITFGRRFRLFLNLGPKVAFLLQQVAPVTNRLDWGLCGGPGIELCLSPVHILLETRYYYALGNLLDSRKEDPFPQSSLRTLSLNLLLMFSPQR